MTRKLTYALFAFALACGGDKPPPVTNTAKPPPTIRLPEDTHPVVARVNGQPIFASCVSGQMRDANVDKATALEQCVAFELLTQEAEKEGLEAHEEVRAAAESQLVQTMLQETFYKTYSGPESLPKDVLAAWWTEMPHSGLPIAALYNHGPVRAMTYCHFQAPKAPPIKEDSTPEFRAGAEKMAKSYPARRARADAMSRLFYGLVLAIEGSGRDIGRQELIRLCNQIHRMQDGDRVEWLAVGVPMPGREVHQIDPVVVEALDALPRKGATTPPVDSSIGHLVMRLDAKIPDKGVGFQRALPEILQKFWNGTVIPSDREPAGGEKAYDAEIRRFRTLLFDKWSSQFYAGRDVVTHDDRIPAPNEETAILRGAAPVRP